MFANMELTSGTSSACAVLLPALPSATKAVPPHDIASVGERAARHLCPDDQLEALLAKPRIGAAAVVWPQTLPQAARAQLLGDRGQAAAREDVHLKGAESVALEKSRPRDVSASRGPSLEEERDQLGLVGSEELGRQKVEIPRPASVATRVSSDCPSDEYGCPPDECETSRPGAA